MPTRRRRRMQMLRRRSRGRSRPGHDAVLEQYKYLFSAFLLSRGCSSVFGSNCEQAGRPRSTSGSPSLEARLADREEEGLRSRWRGTGTTCSFEWHTARAWRNAARTTWALAMMHVLHCTVGGEAKWPFIAAGDSFFLWLACPCPRASWAAGPLVGFARYPITPPAPKRTSAAVHACMCEQIHIHTITILFRRSQIVAASHWRGHARPSIATRHSSSQLEPNGSSLRSCASTCRHAARDIACNLAAAPSDWQAEGASKTSRARPRELRRAPRTPTSDRTNMKR